MDERRVGDQQRDGEDYAYSVQHGVARTFSAGVFTALAAARPRG